MNTERKWGYAEEWNMPGNDFMIVVRHSRTGPLESSFCELGEHRWFVYAYIYPKHRRFLTFVGPDIFQDACNRLPLHAGASLLRYHRNDKGEVSSVQVGSDYNHLGDDHYTFLESKDEASAVFYDADRLFERLSEVESQS